MLNANLTDMNKINIIQPVPKKACEHSGDICSCCKYETPHPSPTPSDWSSKDWDGEKAKAMEQRSLIAFDPPKPDLRQMTNSEIVNNLPIQNLTIQEDKKEEVPEITDTLVPPPEASAATPMMYDTKQENIMEKKDIEGLTDQEKMLQKEGEEYAIYIAGLSEEEESDTKTDTDESPYFF